MVKKVLAFIIVLLIAIQIPLIVVLSNAKKASSKLDAYEEKIKKTAAPISAARDIFSFVKKQVPMLPEELVRVPAIFEKGKGNFEVAKALINKILYTMYASLLFTLFLIFLLFLLYKRSFFKNIGLSFVISGGLCLLNAGLVYYFFVLNFGSTFKYFYDLSGISSQTGFSLALPFVSQIVKSFSRDFVSYISNSIMTRSLFSAAVLLSIGITLIYFQKLLLRWVKLA